MTAVAARDPHAGLLGRVPPPLLVLGSITSVQIGSAYATKIFDRVGPGGAVFLRVGFGALIMLALSRPSFIGLTARTWRTTVAYSLCLVAMNLSFYEAIARIPLGVAVTIEFLGPLVVAIIGSRRIVDLVWALLAAAGVAMLSSGSGSLGWSGIGFAALAGVFWAGYILVSPRLGAVLPGSSGLTLALVIGAVATAPFGLASGGAELGSPGVLLAGAALGLLSSVIPYSFELAALRRIPTRVFGILMSIEPAWAAATGFVILGQSLLAREVVGIGCAVVASVGVTVSNRRTAPPDALPPETGD